MIRETTARQLEEELQNLPGLCGIKQFVLGLETIIFNMDCFNDN